MSAKIKVIDGVPFISVFEVEEREEKLVAALMRVEVRNHLSKTFLTGEEIYEEAGLEELK